MRRRSRLTGLLAGWPLMAGVAHAAALDAVAASGCPAGESDTRIQPGQRDASLLVVATLSGGGAHDLGELCVALVRRSADGFAPVALLAEADRPSPPAGIEPVTYATVSVGGRPVRLAGGRTGFAVTATGVFSSLSTQASASRAYVFARAGTRLVAASDVGHARAARPESAR